MLTVADRIEAAAHALAEGRIIQHAWRRRTDGREFVCPLAAFGPDINSPKDCPAELMPPWMAELVPVLDDGVAAGDVHWFVGEVISRARRWHVLDGAAWERVRVGFQIAAIRQARTEARAARAEAARAAAALAAAWAAALAAAAEVYRRLCETLFVLIDSELPA